MGIFQRNFIFDLEFRIEHIMIKAVLVYFYRRTFTDWEWNEFSFILFLSEQISLLDFLYIYLNKSIFFQQYTYLFWVFSFNFNSSFFFSVSPHLHIFSVIPIRIVWACEANKRTVDDLLFACVFNGIVQRTLTLVDSAT